MIISHNALCKAAYEICYFFQQEKDKSLSCWIWIYPISSVCKHYRSRSASSWRSCLIRICSICHLLSNFVVTYHMGFFYWSLIWSRSGLSKYSAGQGLILNFITDFWHRCSRQLLKDIGEKEKLLFNCCLRAIPPPLPHPPTMFYTFSKQYTS